MFTVLLVPIIVLKISSLLLEPNKSDDLALDTSLDRLLLFALEVVSDLLLFVKVEVNFESPNKSSKLVVFTLFGELLVLLLLLTLPLDLGTSSNKISSLLSPKRLENDPLEVLDPPTPPPVPVPIPLPNNPPLPLISLSPNKSPREFRMF